MLYTGGMNQLATLAQSGTTGVLPIVMNFLAVIVLTVVLFAFAMKAGRAAFISLVLALYVGFGLFMVFPWKAQVIAGDGVTKAVAALLLFVALSAIPFLILRRVNTMGSMRVHALPLFGLCALSAGALLAISYHFLNLAKILPATAPLTTYILPEQYLFYWLAAPLVGFFVFAR